MAIFLCGICAETKESDSQPDFCANCGTQDGPWTMTVDGLTRVHLSSGSGKFIVENHRDITRNEFKLFFPEVRDDDGDQIYKYCDPGRVMLRFAPNTEGALEVSSPEASTNYFTHNGTKIDSSPIRVRKGDRISLYSVNQARVIAVFDVD